MTDNTAQVDLKSLSIGQLREYIANAESRISRAKLELAAMNDEITARLTPQASALFTANAKLSGDVTLTTADGLKFKASISKTVKWDSDKLRDIAATMEWSAAQRLFDIDFSVPERTFNAIPDEALRAKIADARTVKYGDLTIKPVNN